MSEVDKFLDSYESNKNGGQKLASTSVKPASEVDALMQTAPPQDKGFLGHARDLGLSAVKSAIAVPETLVGLADIPTGGRVGKFLENEGGSFGFRPKEAKEILGEFHTEAYKDQQSQFQQADGVLDKTAVAIQNPSLIANAVTESVAPMLAGGVAARGLMAGTRLGQAGAIAAERGATAAQQAQAAGRAAAAAGAIGEGTMMAGAQAEAIRQEADDGLLTPTQAGAAVATGLAGTLFGYLGGRVAQRFGFGDIDTMIARGTNPQGVASEIASLPAKSIPRQVIEGAISEGFLEELPQSISEQIIQNLALGKDWSEGVEDAAVMGTLAGMAMGGGASLYSGMTRPEAPTGEAPPPATGAEPPAAPPQGFTPAAERPVIDEAALGRAGVYPPAPAPIINERALEAVTPSQQMGLDPAAGPMSAAAALAVDTGASAAMQQAAQSVDPETGEIMEPAPVGVEQAQIDQNPAGGIADQLEAAVRSGITGDALQAQISGVMRDADAADVLTALKDRPDLDSIAQIGLSEPAWNMLRSDLLDARGVAPEDRSIYELGDEPVAVKTENDWRFADMLDRLAEDEGWLTDADAERALGFTEEDESDAIEDDEGNAGLAQADVAGRAQTRTPATAPSTPAQAAGEGQEELGQFDVSGRTPEQLQHLASNGQAGWKEAAQAELQRRAAPPTAAQPTQVSAAPEQSRPAPNTRSESAQQSEATPPAASAEGWDGMTAEQRAAVLTKPGGWSTAKGGLNVIGKKLAGQNWTKINPATRATIERLMQGAPDVQPAKVDAASGQGAGAVPAGSAGDAPVRPVDIGRVDRPAGAPARSGEPGVSVGTAGVQQPAGVEGAADTVAAQPAAAKFDSQSGTTRTQAERELWEKGAESERAESDVGVTAGTQVRFVPLADAVATVREAEQAGVAMTPFQVHQATGIRVGDAERVIREAQQPADAATQQQAPFDPVAWDKARANTIKASRDAGNVHLDQVPRYVETMRGQAVFYVHDPKVRGVIRTVDNRGSVYVDWNDAYSAEKELASPTQEGKKTVYRSSIGISDLKDYALAPDRRDPPADTARPDEGATAQPATPEFTTLKDRDGKRDNPPTVEEVAVEKQQAASAAGDQLGAKPAQTPDVDRFANNKLFTADKVAAARARMKAKLGTLNSGIDPELLVDGMTIAGAYIESGVRNFTQYAKAMIEDMGDGVKPYLLSFWEGARNYPGLDTKDMTGAEESRRQFDALLTPEDLKTDAVGEIAEKPKKRSRKSGEKGDMALTQDWGVETIDGYGDDAREVGNDTKDAFIKEARNYLNAVADQLRTFGFEPHVDGKGKPAKPVRSNEGGAYGSGDVSLTMRNGETGQNVYIHIGDTSLRGSVPVTPSGIAVMFRTGKTESLFVTNGTNQWAPVDLSAKDLAQLVNESAAANKPARAAVQQEKRNNEPAADGAQDQGRAEAVRGGRGSDPQQDPAPADSGNMAPRQPEDGRPAGEAGDSGRSGVRVPGADVARGKGEPQGRASGDGRARAGGAGSPDAGAGGAGSDGDLGGVSSPAATSAQAQDLHIDNPLEIVGGSPVQRFNRNRAALELLQTLTEEGRQSTPDEQKVLAGYIGWGSFGQELFQGSWERPAYKDEGIWKERGQWLRDTLGESAWKSAQRSITNAHYTDPPTVLAMWDMVRRMGFEGGKVLEPSMGTGNFFSMMPADLRARSQLTGIELDETTGAIAKQLFPRSNVRIMGYQDSKTPDGFYDLIIGNWPFENTPVADRRYNKLNPMLHDYFFLKTMDQVRPGGIVIGITSAGSMDKQNTAIRRELAKQAELVAAIRLPSGAFEEYAGTKVVTDIVVLRKRPQRLVATPSAATWVETGDYKTPAGETIKVNRYYLDNPQNIIGTLDFGSGTTTFRAGMIVRRPDNMAEQLQKAIEMVPQGAILPRGKVDHLTYYANETGERHGALALVNDRLMIAVGDQLVEANEASKYVLKDAKKTAAREQQLRAAIDLRKKHAALVDAERGGRPADDARKALRGAYDAFVKAHGGLRDSFALKYLERINDPFFAELAALENDDGTPAAVMERSTTRGRRALKNPSVRDAYVLARNQSVNPSVAEVARLAGKPEQAVKAELLDSGAVFEAPNGDVVPSDIYLSGNVRQKLREAQAALDEGNTAMRANVAALKEVMPEDVPYFNIETQFGATWVPNEVYAQYIAHMLGRSGPKGVEVSFRAGRWKVKMEPGLSRIPEAAANYGTPGYPFNRLVQAAISNQVLRLTSKDENGNDVYDAARTEEANARIAKIREDFGAWLWSDPERRQDLEREYNEARNAWATPTYDGSFLTFEGMALTLGNGAFQLRQHQVNAIWRATVNRRSINAHEVGTGKTFTMGGIAVESRRYGIAKKPMLLAHNANSATVAAEIRMMYPSARVLYVDNLQGDKKEIRLRQIANDDWDVIVVPHSLISSLALREETMMRMAEDDIKALEAEFFDAAREDNINPETIDLDDDKDIAKIRSVTAKELAKARKRIIENIKKQSQKSSKEGAIAFEDLGVDMILVDEVHEFKKPPIVTRMKMKGLNTQVSNRSIALQFLTRYVRQMNNGGNVHTFTGTPITNTITEIYHQMRYVMEAEMEQATIADWDGWFGSFAAEVQDVELTAAGDYEMVSRLAGFVNVPELRAMVGQYMDTVFAEDMPEMRPRKVNGKELSDPGLTEAERAELLNGRTEGAEDRPYKKVINDAADMTAEQMRIFTRLQQYAREWRSATGKQKKEWMRAGDPRSPIITEGIANKASFDVRLLDDEGFAGQEGRVPDEPTSKASRVVKNVLEIYSSHPNANQVIFSETGFGKRATRSAGSIDGEKQTVTLPVFATMHDIVERLVQGGIPREQIAIVDGSTSKERRKEIAEAMNASTIRVVIGSTDTLGVGVNMQRNLRAMHHVDAPYMPGELEQRNGRGMRQRNQWNTVLEYRYMTDRLDGKRWQILAVKQRFINAFMKAAAGTRVIEGEAAADEQSDILESFSEAAGDPRILQRVKMQKKLETLNRKERMYTQGIADMRRQERSSAELADRLTRELKQLADSRTQANIEELIAGQQQAFAATIDGTTYDTRKDAAEALQAFIETNVRIGDSMKTVGEYAGHPLRIEWPRHMDAPVTQIDAFGQEFAGKGIAGAEAKMRNFPSVIENKTKRRDMERATAENMRAAMNQPFAQAAALERITKQLQDLEKDLEINPVPPPAWLRQGAPIDSEVHRNKRPYIVAGHRYSKDGWFVIAEDDKGTVLIPYMEATDEVGMPMYEEREFVPPVVIEKEKEGTAPADAPADVVVDRSAQSATTNPLRNADGTFARQAPAGDSMAFSARPAGALLTGITEKGLVRAMRLQFNGLAEITGKLLERGRDGKRGGVIVIGTADNAEIGRIVAERTGRKLDSTVRKFSSAGLINGFYDPKTGLTFLVGPNLNPITATAVMLHEMMHGQQRQDIDRRALDMIDSRAKVKDPALRGFLDRVMTRMRMAGEVGNASEASAYIVEQAVIEGRSAGYTLADNAFMQWVDAKIGKRVGDFLRSFAGMIRTWMLRNGLGARTMTVDDFVGYAMAGLDRAASGEVRAGAVKASASIGARAPQSEAFRRWFGDSKVVDASGQPLVVYHGTDANITEFKVSERGTYGGGIYLTPDTKGASDYAIYRGQQSPTVYPLYASIKNPATGAEAARIASWRGEENARAELIARGYDGVIDMRSGEIVAFYPEQIKSATGNNGDFDPDNDDIRFSRSGLESAQQTAKNIGAGLKAITIQDVKKAGKHKLTDWLKLGLQFLGRRQLTDIYGDVLPLADYDRLAAQMEADKNDVGAAADELARRWGKLPDEGKLADLMHDATLAQIDADSAVEYAPGDDLAASRALKAQFSQLSAEAQKVYREARDHYRKHHAEVRQAIIDRIMRSELREERRAELLKRMDADFFKAIKGVYFPLARFGQYVVVTKDNAGKVASVSRAETMAEAEAMRAEMVKAFPARDGYHVGRVILSKEFVAGRDMVGRGFMTELYEALDEQGLDPIVQAELEDTLGQLYLSSLPDLSWAKHGIHRKGTPGFSSDARRAFAQNTFHGARYLAKLKYGDQMQAELDRMQKHVDEMAPIEGFDQPAAQRVADEMNKRHEATMNPKGNPLSTALTSFGFVYYLGISPAAAMVNLSQTPLVAYPVMGAKWGFRKAGAALMAASAEVVEGKNDLRAVLAARLKNEQDPKALRKHQDEIAAYDEAVRTGVIDVTMAHDLAGIAQGEDAKVMWKIRPVMRLASYLFHNAERFNRQATFLAAYRLARDAGAKHDTAYSQAVKATYDGHFDYSTGNRPRVMQGNVAKVVLLFKQYAQNMIYTIARNAYQSVKGESPEVRREARKVFGALMTTHAAAAGVLGLPMVGTLLTLASALGGSDDEPWDAEVALRNMLADAFGPGVSEVIAKGFSRLTPWDISGRVSLDKLLLPDVNESLEGQRWAESFATAMLGPVIGMGVNAAKGAQKMADGDYARGLEDMLPVFARNPIKAYRQYSEGEVDRTGVVIKDEVSLAGVLGQASGFSPSEIRLAFEGRSAVMSADRRLAERRQDLMTQFARAAMDQDQDGMTDARAAIAEFNKANPGRRITPPQLWQSVRNRERRIREAEDGVYLPRTRRDVLDAGRFAEAV